MKTATQIVLICTLGPIALAMILALLMLLGFYNAWAISLLWGWFIVPAFALPALTILQAWGLAIFVTYLTYHPQSNQHNKDLTAYFIGEVVKFMTKPLIAVGIGWLVKTLFM